MKTIILISFSFLVAVNLYSKEVKEEVYYYYKNEKIHLRQNDNKILVKLSDEYKSSEVERMNDINYELTKKIVKKKKEKYLVLETNKNVSIEEKLQYLTKLQNNSFVESANFMLTTLDEKNDIGFSDQFTVKLYPNTSNLEFNELLNKYSCKVVNQNKYDSDVFTVRVLKNAEKKHIRNC